MSEPLPQRSIPAATIRPMRLADVPDVLEVERASYRFPWSDGIFRDCIRVGYLCRVLEIDDQIVGYGILSYGAGEAHVLNVCVREDLRGTGLGRRLMEVLLDCARAAGMEHAFLEVRPSNPAAVHLYESMGFARVGLRRAYYQAAGGREDALVYRLALTRRKGD
ncbi:MAG TPA: ribosomal protein S18-alanine N-acetyltransferase [Steroidobacteraceae bacterium]|nr:ribosomal protein S18-alanine N-acetyltransferase [Steroidobacteraceae bacterium]